MSEYDFKTYRLKITVLTPLHIGSGREMLREYDFVENGGEIWRVNENALLDEWQEGKNIDDPKTLDMLMRQKPAELLKDLLENKDYEPDSKLFRYQIPGAVRADQGRVREFIKDVNDHPYLPGTSLKGALRTAIGWWEWEQKHLHPALSKVGPLTPKNKKKAADGYEQDIFFPNAPRGKGPNYDLMRALQISDSHPLKPENMAVVNVTVFRNWDHERYGDKISSLEILPTGREINGVTVKIDTRLFSGQWEKLELGDAKRLTDWAPVCQKYAAQRMDDEIAYYREQARGSSAIQNAIHLYQRWQNHLPAADEPAFLLQLGWGTGWSSKTFNSHLRKDDEFMLEIISGFKLGMYHSDDYRSGDEFPMSRRLPQVAANSPLGYPLGWVLVNVAEKDADFKVTDWQKQILEVTDETQRSEPVISTPAPRAVPKPAPKPLIEQFTDVPKIGDRFKGKVFNQEGRELDLHIPGLDATVALAHIAAENNDTSKKYKEGAMLVCEVIDLKQIGQVWQVECRRG